MLKELRSCEQGLVETSRRLDLHSPIMNWEGSGRIHGAVSAA